MAKAIQIRQLNREWIKKMITTAVVDPEKQANLMEVSVIADSISVNKKRITTFELTYPRFIHSEFLTHRLFSRNSASSRAIPFEKVLEQVKNNPASPLFWGVNKPGMQAGEYLKGHKIATAKFTWLQAAKSAVIEAEKLNKLGLHKQVVNRVLEPFVFMRTVLTTTELANWFWLRDHKDAQPEIRKLAQLMYEALSFSKTKQLKPGEWHVPYYEEGYWAPTDIVEAEKGRVDIDENGASLEEAKAISASCCAQVSYRTNDSSLEKALKIKDRLIGDGEGPVHASPFEHQATPMQFCDSEQYLHNILTNCKSQSDLDSGDYGWEDGITHVATNKEYWSGNFCGWIQNRQLIKGHSKWS